MKVCLANFDGSECIFNMDLSLPKEDQVKGCRSLKCERGSVTEKTINGKEFLIISCDRTWNPFENRPLTKQEKAENFP